MQNAKSISILLVDDDDVDAMGVERALNQFKLLNPVIRARDGYEAFDILLNPNAVNQPYIILLDINMPRMNGLEFLGNLRKHPTLSSAVVFILSTSNDKQDKIAAYQKNAAGYILKNQFKDGYQPLISLLGQYGNVVELPIMGS